ncbi:MAG: hypothetical protein NTAFB05_09430 [Nitrobacter sp.]|uniref:DUF3551 domain-containing protein n=1 Tax=Nitrobacter sp. TaxID=29420 RepID=UPI00387DF7D2
MGSSEMHLVERKVTTCRSLLAATCAGVVASFLVLAPSAAEARDYPYCIKGDYYVSALGDCSFETYEQCHAAASGRLAYCDVNPFYRFQEDGRTAYPDARRTFRR